MTPHVREATERDLNEINEIYSFYVLKTHVTFDVDPMTSAQRAGWFSHYDTKGPHRVLVATEPDGDVVGFASSSRWRPKAAYDTSVETSVYVAPNRTGARIGSTLYAALFEILAEEDVHRAYAGIALPNAGSMRLHEKFGFTQAALFSEQGRKFGQYWDVAWLEKKTNA